MPDEELLQPSTDLKIFQDRVGPTKFNRSSHKYANLVDQKSTGFLVFGTLAYLFPITISHRNTNRFYDSGWNTYVYYDLRIIVRQKSVFIYEEIIAPGSYR